MEKAVRPRSVLPRERMESEAWARAPMVQLMSMEKMQMRFIIRRKKSPKKQEE